MFIVFKHANGDYSNVTVAENFHLQGVNNFSFVLKEFLSGGGNGAIFLADRLDQNGNHIGPSAVKILKQLDSSRIDRFKNEIRILKDLDHPSITPFYDEGEVKFPEFSNPVPWMAMRPGLDNLEKTVKDNGPLSTSELKSFGANICDAISHLHSKEIIHRDVKPANFVLSKIARETEIFMIDFGIAKYIGEDVSARPLDNFTKTMEFVGPVFFSSPELIKYADDKTYPVDYRSDIFQIGKVLWYLATGDISAGIPSKKKDPFQGPLFDLVFELLQDDPDDRLQNAQEIKARLVKI